MFSYYIRKYIFQEFFKAAEEGSIDRLDELFDATANIDPNMTHVRNENLRNNQQDSIYHISVYRITSHGRYSC